MASSLQAAEFLWHFMVSGCCFAASLSLFIYPFGHSGSEKKNILIKKNKTKQEIKCHPLLGSNESVSVQNTQTFPALPHTEH